MDTRATLTPEEWQAMVKLRGPKEMNRLADWMAEHVGLPLRYRAKAGEEAVRLKAATITNGHLVVEFRQIVVHPKHTVEYLDDGWQTMGFPLQSDPPFWVQKRLSFT